MTAAVPSLLDLVPTVEPSPGMVEAWTLRPNLDQTLHRGEWLLVHAVTEAPSTRGGRRIRLRLAHPAGPDIVCHPLTLRHARPRPALGLDLPAHLNIKEPRP